MKTITQKIETVISRMNTTETALGAAGLAVVAGVVVLWETGEVMADVAGYGLRMTGVVEVMDGHEAERVASIFIGAEDLILDGYTDWAKAIKVASKKF